MPAAAEHRAHANLSKPDLAVTTLISVHRISPNKFLLIQPN